MSASAALAQSISLTVRPDRDRIYLGESFNLHVTVNGADNGVDTPDLSALANVDTVLLGSQSNSRRSISIVNGRFSQENTLARIFVFQVNPRREGVLITGPITLRHDGQILSASGPPVTVTGINRQSVVVGTIEASTTAALVDEPFTITLHLALAPLSPPYHAEEPIHANKPPRIEAGFLNIAEIKGLRQPDLNAILSERAQAASGRTPAFYINDYAHSGPDMNNPFSFDMNPRPIGFRFEPTRENRNGTNYWVYSLALDYTPQTEGDHTFGPLIFKGPVITAVNPDNTAQFSEIFAVAPAVTVRVTPPPEKGRPEWFIGTLGRDFAARASFDTAVCKVGDPLTLTLDVTGAISLSNLRPPLLTLQENLSHDFRIYDDSVTTATIESGKRFTWRVRPLRAGTLEFPPIRLAYYDTATKAYVTVDTQPIPIQARPTTQVVSDAANAPGTTRLSLNVDDAPTPAAVTLGHEVSPLLPPTRLLWSLFLSGPIALLVALSGRFVWRRRHHLHLASRRRGAAARARRRLDANPDPATITAALRAYLAERLDTFGHSLTPPEVANVLTAHGVTTEQAAAWQAFLERLDETLYRPGATASATAKEAAALIASTETALTDRRRGGASVSIMSIVSIISIVSITSAAASAATESSSRAFAWERANTQMAAAHTASEFYTAAQAYNRLVLAGDTCGALFYNLGTALLLAGDAPNAVAAFKRAERRLGSTPATRTNLRLAYGMIEAPATVDFSPQNLPPAAPLLWTHTAFFWHYEFPCRHRAAAAAVGWALLFVALLLRLVKPVFARPILYAGLFLFAIFGVSATVSLLQEYRDTKTWPARVLVRPGAETEVVS